MQILTLLSLVFFSSGKSPVTWTATCHKINPTEYNLVFTAMIEDGWNIYSQHMKGDDGPLKTAFEYTSKEHFQLMGKNEESGEILKAMDEMFGMEVIKIKHKGTFTQRIKVSDTSKPVSGFIEYMCCNNMQCLPPKQVPFTIDLRTAN